MDASVSVPLPLLEDIFRLLDCLDDLGRDDSRKGGRDVALWELGLKIERLRSRIVETYLLTVDGPTEDELRDLEEWVAGGNSVYDNPCLLCDESGRTMDFIGGCRAWLDMCEAGSSGDAGDDEDLPF